MTQCFFPGLITPKNKTVVFRVVSPLSGSKLRIGFCNRFGKRPYAIGGMTVNIGGKLYEITLNGEKRFQIPRNTVLRSDEIDVVLNQGEEVEIRFLPTTHAVDVNYIEENTVPHSCNCLYADVLPEYKYSKPTDKLQLYRLLPMVDAIEVYGTQKVQKIVAFGDSITALSRWTKPLSARLSGAYGEQYILLNAGISGNCLTYKSNGMIRRAYGPKGVERFQYDVLDEGEIHAVIFAIGTNDLALITDKNRAAVSLDSLIHATETVFALLKERGIRIVAANVMPRMGDGGFTPAMDAIRKAYNMWLADCPAIDYLVDWDSVGRDPQKPEYLRDGFHMGDHLHPSADGGRELADCFDLSRLIGK